MELLRKSYQDKSCGIGELVESPVSESPMPPKSQARALLGNR